MASKFYKNRIVPRLRLYTILIVLLKIYLSNCWLYLVRHFIKKEKFKNYAKKVNQKNAYLLFKTILLLKGLFIKVGQFLSLRVDLLPKEYTQTLSRLQDQVPALKYHQIKKRIIDELGKDPEEIFPFFNHQAVASASLAQVHQAELKSKDAVAVKILYPDIEKVVATDLKILNIVLSFIHLFRRHFNYKIIVNEFEKYVSQEIDLINEGRNIEKMKEVLKLRENIVLPEVLWEYTTKGILTTNFIEGIKITDVDKIKEKGINIKEVAQEVIDCYFYQIFKGGFFQADPHPGNLFVIPTPDKPKMGIVDFGLCKELPTTFMVGLQHASLAMVNRDSLSLAKGLTELGFATFDEKEETLLFFCDFVMRHLDEIIYKKTKEINFTQIYQEIIELAREKPIVRIPSDFILIGRVMGLLTGLGRQLRAKVDLKNITLTYLSSFN